MERIEGKIIDFPWKVVNKNYFNFEINEAKRTKAKIFNDILKVLNIKKQII